MTDSVLAPIAALSLPDSAQLTSRAQGALEFIESFVVEDAETYGFAADELKSIKARANKLEDQRTAITGPINSALKAVNALFKGPAELLARGEQVLKTKLLAYDQAQAAIAAEAKRKADAEAAAERKRLEEEAAKLAAEARKNAEAAAAAAAAGDAQAAMLAQANAERAQAAAQQTVQESQLVTVAAPAVQKAKATGLSTRSSFDYEVISLQLLVEHIAKHPELLNLVIPDSVRLRAYVKSLGAACNLPGVKVIERQTMSARAA